MPELLMQYRAQDKYLGFYTARAINVKFVKLPETTFSIREYNIVTKEQLKAYADKYKERKKESEKKKRRLLKNF